MKHLIINVAGLGWETTQRFGLTHLNGCAFKNVLSVFPAVTCTAQATLRTATEAREHGMIANGIFLRNLQRPAFWEQSSQLVSGKRIWEEARKNGYTIGMFYFQQSLGEDVDELITPWPIHKHHGGMILKNYSRPLNKKPAGYNENFPLQQYWGPLANAKVGNRIVNDVVSFVDCDIAFVYIPTLDYDFQRYPATHKKCAKAITLLKQQLEQLFDFAKANNAEVTILGDYEITEVTLPPAQPNLTLREAGYFATRNVNGHLYPDFNHSRAFAMADHEIAHVYIRDANDIAAVKSCLEATGDYAIIEERKPSAEWGHDLAGELLLQAKPGSWCAYTWWTLPHEAPDYATHIDIHSKPGYDPCELFFERWAFPPKTCQDLSRIKGTHGHKCEIAYLSTMPQITGSTFVELSDALAAWCRSLPKKGGA